MLSKEIGLLENEILHASSAARVRQLEAVLTTLRTTYQNQCLNVAASPRGLITTAHLFNEGVLFNIVEANGVRVVFGGNDGILVTIDGTGHIHIYGPDGPGDPVLRSAVTSILQGLNTLRAPLLIEAQAA
jgi:hypothetical protein